MSTGLTDFDLRCPQGSSVDKRHHGCLVTENYIPTLVLIAGAVHSVAAAALPHDRIPFATPVGCEQPARAQSEDGE